ncbi:hypothetical protein D3C76_967690 [compost metagenome]
MAVSENRRHPLRRLVVRQVDHHELTTTLVLMAGLHRLVSPLVGQAKLPTGDVRTTQANHAKRLATSALPPLTRQHQQDAVANLGGAVVLLGQAGDEVEVRLVELIDP